MPVKDLLTTTVSAFWYLVVWGLEPTVYDEMLAGNYFGGLADVSVTANNIKSAIKFSIRIY